MSREREKNTYSQTSRLENPEELQLHQNHENFLFLTVLLLFAQCKMHYWWLVTWLDLTCFSNSSQLVCPHIHAKATMSSTETHVEILPNVPLVSRFKEDHAGNIKDAAACFMIFRYFSAFSRSVWFCTYLKLSTSAQRLKKRVAQFP
jgi:hypothetical protein